MRGAPQSGLLLWLWTSLACLNFAFNRDLTRRALLPRGPIDEPREVSGKKSNPRCVAMALNLRFFSMIAERRSVMLSRKERRKGLLFGVVYLYQTIKA
jgi:hypothetical protein